jgi:hypothetical protein
MVACFSRLTNELDYGILLGGGMTWHVDTSGNASPDFTGGPNGRKDPQHGFAEAARTALKGENPEKSSGAWGGGIQGEGGEPGKRYAQANPARVTTDVRVPQVPSNPSFSPPAKEVPPPSGKVIPFVRPGAAAAEAVAGSEALTIVSAARLFAAPMTLPLLLSGDTLQVEPVSIAGRDKLSGEIDRHTGKLTISLVTGWFSSTALATVDTQFQSSKGGRQDVIGANGQKIGEIDASKVTFTAEALAALDVLASGKPAGGGKEESGKEPVADAQPAPVPKPEEKDKCEQTEASSGAQHVGKVMPAPQQIGQLVAEHSKDGEPLTPAATATILTAAQPEGTRQIAIAGDNTQGPDAYFLDDCGKLLGTVQIKAVNNWNGVNLGLRGELGAAMPSAGEKLKIPFQSKFGSDVIAIQVPSGTDASKFMARYWGQPERRATDLQEGWTSENNPHAGRRVLFVDDTGKILSGPSPAFDPN